MVQTILDWLHIILDWLAKRNWKNWSMWAAIGQMIVALATFWTARIALKLMRREEQQEKDTKRRERDLLEPRLSPKISIKNSDNGKKIIYFTLANIRMTPAFVDDFVFVNVYEIPEIEPHSYEIIETEVPERVIYGGVCTTKVPLSYLKRLITENDREEGFFQFRFSLATGKLYTFSVYLKVGSAPSEWYIYLANKDVTVEEIVNTGTQIHYVHNKIINVARNGNRVG